VRFALVLALFALAGCGWIGNDRSTVYLYDNAPSCEDSLPCNFLSVRAEVVLSVSKESQTAVYLYKPLVKNGDNASTPSWKQLSHCTVIDIKNFHCDELTRVDGDFSDRPGFDAQLVSTSVTISLLVRGAGYGRRSAIVFLANYGTVLVVAASLVATSVLLIFLGSR
jgi:hypothetical protein